jgi:hypothetical protein
MKICDVAICHRPVDYKSQYNFCQRHEKGFIQLGKTYSDWVKAYGNKYSKKKYYVALLTNEEIKTGIWIREVINHILEEEASQ